MDNWTFPFSSYAVAGFSLPFPAAALLLKEGDRMALNYREEAFVDEYFKHEGNCYAAAIAAGYAEKTAKESSKWINENTLKNPNKKSMYKPELVAAIEERREQLKNERVADAQEILEFHTRVLRGKETEETLVIEGVGMGETTASLKERPATLKEKQSSADALAKLLGLVNNKVNIEGAVPVVFAGEDSLDD
ncbi:MAG: terminase small subunit [Clostridia bacterium]|nr:terminase small subunit [Clostridia bacterium]